MESGRGDRQPCLQVWHVRNRKPDRCAVLQMLREIDRTPDSDRDDSATLFAVSSRRLTEFRAAVEHPILTMDGEAKRVRLP